MLAKSNQPNPEEDAGMEITLTHSITPMGRPGNFSDPKVPNESDAVSITSSTEVTAAAATGRQRISFKYLVRLGLAAILLTIVLAIATAGGIATQKFQASQANINEQLAKAGKADNCKTKSPTTKTKSPSLKSKSTKRCEGEEVCDPQTWSGCPGSWVSCPGSCNPNSCGCCDETCVATVCAIDPFCCNAYWDSICDGEARDPQYCGFTCVSYALFFLEQKSILCIQSSHPLLL